LKEVLSGVNGCLCEIKTMDNEFLALGRVGSYQSEEKTLEVVACDDVLMPSAPYATKVKVSVFTKKRGFLLMEGFTYITHKSFWRLYDVSSLGENERRSYFRLKTFSPAEVEAIPSPPAPSAPAGSAEATQAATPAEPVKTFPCVVTSISVSGLLLAVDDPDCRYGLGSVLRVKSFTVGQTDQHFTLKCRVMRTDRHEKLGRLFGCAFIDLGAKEVERLCHAIFAQERIEIRRKRGLS
jgi:hypothetical protein